MGSMSRKQGQSVKLIYSGTPGAEAVAVLIYDADDTVLTLQPYQRLVIDEVSFNSTATADTADLAFLVEAAVAPTAPPAAGLGLVATFSLAVNIGTQGQIFPGEGYACARSNTLWLLDDGNGWNGKEVDLVGVGRIVETTRGRQASAGRCLLTPGGTPGQNF